MCTICEELDALCKSIEIYHDDDVIVYREDDIRYIQRRISQLLKEHYELIKKECIEDDDYYECIYYYKCKHCGRIVKFEQ